MDKDQIQEIIKAAKADIVNMAAEAGAKAALAAWEKKKVSATKSRHDKRLRNTRLLLKHYNYFKNHIDKSIYCSDQLNAIDVLDELDELKSSVYISSIKKSAEKTYIILSHIDTMLGLYEAYCDKAGEAERRKYRILEMFYFDQVKMAEILNIEHISERTFFRDIDDAVNKLSALIFGIDAVNEMNEMAE